MTGKAIRVGEQTMVDESGEHATPLAANEPLRFRVTSRDERTKARAGLLLTPHGLVRTPVFMPVGTHATVKAVGPDDLHALGASIVLSNTYHLLLRPGPELVARFGGLHGFMRWDGPILTDSGGFQVFSLGKLREISDARVVFRSHLDGSEIVMTPESVQHTEALLGADIILPLDEPPPFDSISEVTRAATERTHRWAERAIAARERPGEQALFGIPQGGMDAALRAESARTIGAMPFDGFSIGGLSVGEPKPVMWAMLDATIPNLPDARPRHLLGVGSPDDLLEGIERGVDMFDCVLPTRTARTGGLYTARGRLNVRTARYRDEQGPVDPDCDCYTCRTFSAGYLHHLIRAEEDESRGELLYYRLASIHNLRFLVRLVEQARAAILAGTFPEFKASFMAGFIPPDRGAAEEQKRKREKRLAADAAE